MTAVSSHYQMQLLLCLLLPILPQVHLQHASLPAAPSSVRHSNLCQQGVQGAPVCILQETSGLQPMQPADESAASAASLSRGRSLQAPAPYSAAAAPGPADDSIDYSSLEVLQQPCPTNWQPPAGPGLNNCKRNYSVGVEHDSSLGCLWEQQANYYTGAEGSTDSLLDTVADSAGECCQHCHDFQSSLPPCNIWVWCGEPTGCCHSWRGCTQDDVSLTNISPYKSCTLKYFSNFSDGNAASAVYPPYAYTTQQVQRWPDWASDGKSVTSACKSFTSGVALSHLQEDGADNWTEQPSSHAVDLPGIDIPQFDYACSPYLHETQDASKTGNTCGLFGDNEVTAASCLNDPLCSGLVQPSSPCLDGSQPSGTCQTTYLKQFPAGFISAFEQGNSTYPQCAKVAPFLRTILYPERLAPPAPPPAPPPMPPPPLPPYVLPISTAPVQQQQEQQQQAAAAPHGGSSTGGIVGGVVGGVAALMVISSALWCFSKRCSLAARDELGHHHALVNTESSDIGFALGRASAPQLPIPRRKAAWPTSNSSSTTRIGAGAVFSDGQDLGGRPGFVDSQQKPFLSGSNSWSEGSWVEMQPAAAQLDSPDAATKAVHHMSLGIANVEWGVRAEDIVISKNDKGEDHLLGAGAFGAVYKALRNSVEPVAVKVMKGQQDQRTQARFSQEIELLRRIRHANIVMYLGACISKGTTLLITEFMSGGDLWGQLSRSNSEATWYKRGKHIAMDVAQGLVFLHSHNTLHLDIKSPNILLSRDGTAKIADVGLARIMKGSFFTHNVAMGTWAWSAPEVIVGQPVNAKADVFSFGVLLWEICTAEIPDRGALRNLSVPDEAPEAINALMNSCMAPHAQERPDMKQVVRILEQVSKVSEVLSGSAVFATEAGSPG